MCSFVNVKAINNYVSYNDDNNSNTVDLILDYNTTATVAWASNKEKSD